MRTDLESDSYATQRNEARKRRDFILRQLCEGPKLFGELLELGKKEIDGIKSPAGLSKIIDDLQFNTKEINQDETKKDSRGTARKAYALTEKGKRTVEGLWYISYTLDGMKRGGADHTRHERLNKILGIDADVVFNHNTTPQSQELINSNLDGIGWYVANILAQKVKSGFTISETERNQIGIVALELNINYIWESMEYGWRLVSDIKAGRNIFTDKELRLGAGKPYNLFLIEAFIRYAEVYKDAEFRQKLSEIFSVYKNNPKKLIEDFDLELSIVNEVTSEVLAGRNPAIALKRKLKSAAKRENERTKQSLGSEFNLTVDDSFINRYIVMGQLLNYENETILAKLRNYERDLFKRGYDKHLGNTRIIEVKEARSITLAR